MALYVECRGGPEPETGDGVDGGKGPLGVRREGCCQMGQYGWWLAHLQCALTS